MSRLGEGNKRTSDRKYTIVTIYQMVLLFGSSGEFINVWHKDGVSRCKPGTLDIHEGMHRK